MERWVVRPAGFEPTTSCSGGKRSIQLSYGRTFKPPVGPSDVSTYTFEAGCQDRAMSLPEWPPAAAATLPAASSRRRA